MVKKFMSLACLLLMFMAVKAQTPLPLNPQVRHGVLPNGLTYYILHNEEPKERANFYIAQKVGSSLETPEQLGLAHFLEHMAFNGTTHYPGKNMLNYLQTKGIRFGSDINAYTAFDETVYNINNVPTTDKALMDSVLLVLHDWSCDILLEETEINAERGVIQEEWRTRNTADIRFLTHMLPEVYSEYQYQQMPIGKMEIVMNFAPETLRAYYKKWYRPDQQGIVIVGDFDAAEMEKKVIDLFSPIVMPENAAKREYPQISDNKEPIYSFFQDPELRMARATISFKRDQIPAEMRSTVEIYLYENVLQEIISQMINTRLEEYSHDANCKYANAATYFGDFYVSKTKASFNIGVISKGNMQGAIADAMAVVSRACKTGFTNGELQRAKDAMLSDYEKAYNERDKTDNDARAQGLIHNFVDGIAEPGIEQEYELIKTVLPSLPVQDLNQFAATLLTPENQVIVISQPQNDSNVVPEKAQIITTVEEAINNQYEAMKEETDNTPLISGKIKPGKVKAVKNNAQLGTTEYTLSNGARVIVKPTDFASDEILMTAYRNGGKRSFQEKDAADVLLMGDVYDYAKLGQFDIVKLQRYLTGKKVRLGFEIGNATDLFQGQSNIKDLETMLGLIYLSFTDMTPDKATLANRLAAIRPQLEAASTNPMKIFQDKMAITRYGNNPLMQPFTVQTLDAFNYDNSFALLRNTIKNPANFTFIFTGNIDASTFVPLIEKYIGSIKGKKADKDVIVSSIKQVDGQVLEEWKQPMETPGTTVFNLYSGNNLEYNIDNAVKMSLLSDLLDMNYTETLREEEGGTYGASVDAGINPNTGEWNIVYMFQTNAEQQASLMKRAYDELMDLMTNGASVDHFNKVKEAAMKQYEINIRTNSYWNANLMSYARGWDMISGHKAAIENLTLEEMNNFMKNLYNGNNRIQVIMEGVKK